MSWDAERTKRMAHSSRHLSHTRAQEQLERMGMAPGDSGWLLVWSRRCGAAIRDGRDIPSPELPPLP